MAELPPNSPDESAGLQCVTLSNRGKSQWLNYTLNFFVYSWVLYRFNLITICMFFVVVIITFYQLPPELGSGLLNNQLVVQHPTLAYFTLGKHQWIDRLIICIPAIPSVRPFATRMLYVYKVSLMTLTYPHVTRSSPYRASRACYVIWLNKLMCA